MSTRRTKMGCGQFMQHSLANAHPGNNHLPHVQQLCERNEQNRSHAHNLGAIASHSKTIHAAVHVEPQDLPEHLPQAAEIQGIETGQARTRSDPSERLRIAAASDCGAAPDLHRASKLRLQHRTNVRLQLTQSLRRKRPGEIKLLHETNRAERKRESSVDFSPAQETHLQAAATQIENQSGSKTSCRYPEYCLADEPRLFRRTYGYELDAGLAVDSRNQGITIDGFAHGAGGDGRVSIHFVAVEQAPEMQKGF